MVLFSDWYYYYTIDYDKVKLPSPGHLRGAGRGEAVSKAAILSSSPFCEVRLCAVIQRIKVSRLYLTPAQGFAESALPNHCRSPFG